MSEAGERHASWLELFFDLVVVVAVAQLAHRLQHPTWANVALFAVLYYAVWSIWTSLTLYANVRAEQTHTRSMLIGMFGIAVMAAAAPDVAHEISGVGTHDGWFIAAYITCRVSASQSLQAAGTVMTAWPAAQLGAGLAPWFASIWMEPPGRYVMWGLGVVLDVAFSVLQSRRPEKFVDEMRRQAERLERRERRRLLNGRSAHVVRTAVPAVLDPAHLGERLGLFVIIVLGEAVMQVVVAASGHDWGVPLGLAAVAGFGLIVSLWWLTLHYGLSAVPNAGEHGLKSYIALPAHFAMTAGITATAAGMGVVAAAPEEHLHGGTGWVMGGGLAVYFASSAVLGVAARAGRVWIWVWAVPSIVLPLAVAVISGLLPGWGVVALLLLVALWRVAYRPRGGGAVEAAAAA
ncbi:low temperature requirement protein A [Nonomuraea roseoviolacea subsp. roseoviolacea]|uniref:Low temperature requirement protein LtrA n=1 Tax=Nonomuraea roseoviolacea subsp. carminata TaxID=160689 RepID=A0ABT1K7E8_9ACTN|nr:low temperature requirement protein A [Nonomuraea roseoviolacea]MCP2349371.1 low temperature requirement protein LtrA [Nonomuraea roseoviolacea subsp. carminata]